MECDVSTCFYRHWWCLMLPLPPTPPSYPSLLPLPPTPPSYPSLLPLPLVQQIFLPTLPVSQQLPMRRNLYIYPLRLSGLSVRKYKLCLVIITSRVPVEGKSSVCAISMNYRKMILIIIIISLGQILLAYIANTSRTHTQTHHYRRSGCRCPVGRCTQP